MISINDFKFDKLVGKGSYGSVYKAIKKDDNSTYAIKKIKIDNLNHCEKKYVINEIKILASHNSNNLLTYFGVFQNDYSIYIITEYATKGDLYQIIKKHKARNTTFTSSEIWNNFIGICLGLQHLHKNNIIHRDIKCANILIDNNNNIKLGDFGIIKIMPTYMAYAQTQIGTPYYMAPEIYKNQRYSEKCDIWSLGCVLYEMMFLTPPFTGKNIYDLKYKIINGRYVSNLSICNNIELKQLLKSLLLTNPYQRPQITVVLKNPNIVSRLANFDNICHKVKPIFNEHITIPQRQYEWKSIINKFSLHNKLTTQNEKPVNNVTPSRAQAPTPPPAPPPPAPPHIPSYAVPSRARAPAPSYGVHNRARAPAPSYAAPSRSRAPAPTPPTNQVVVQAAVPLNKLPIIPVPPKIPASNQYVRSRVSATPKPVAQPDVSNDNKIPQPPKLPPPSENRARPIPYFKHNISNSIDENKKIKDIPILSNSINKEVMVLNKQIIDLKDEIEIERKNMEIKICHLEHLERKKKTMLNKNNLYVQKDDNVNKKNDIITNNARNEKRDINTPVSGIRNSIWSNTSLDNFTPRNSLLIKIGSRHESNHFLS